MKDLNPRRGFALADLLSSIFIFGTVMTSAVSLFVLCNDYFYTSSAQIDTLGFSQDAVKRLQSELQETDAASVQFSTAHDALVFISARKPLSGSGGGTFQTSNGVPNWQKWVYYATVQDPNGPYNLLIRKESQSIFGGLPSTADQAAPASWQTSFQNLSGTRQTIATGIQTFLVQDYDCDTGNLIHAPYFVQIVATIQYAGKLTSYNPGIATTTSSGTCTSSGNWVKIQVINP